jgi:pyruvate/2-oxoacid:ferredoxin oxidoreductase beta subunit/Pyruvate/2-oxoacid:ferredoxin oxidoreductase gamma subunit
MTTPVTVTPLASFRNATPYPFCPGCGHGSILDHLNAALGRLALDPRRVVIVSDIGCSGLSDQYFDTQAFHGLHGRSLTYATGLKLARPELTVLVVMGDGGTGIGGAHLLAAARRNLDLTLVVFNNFNFGMTGGQHSGTTPEGAFTATTPRGSLERPLDLCATVAAAGATWAYRGTSFDADLGERIAEAISHPGFALVDAWEPCTAYFAPRNRLNRKAITELADRLGFPLGLVARREAPEFGAAYRAAATAQAAVSQGAASSISPRPIAPTFTAALDRRFALVLAGSAGGRVGTAARIVARAAVASGLFAAQRNDYPVTVKTGYSLAEIVLSPEPIDDAGIERPDALVVLSADGRKQALGYLKAMTAAERVFATPEVEELPAPGTVERIDLQAGGKRVAKELQALAATMAAVVRLGLVSAAALRAATGRDEAAVRAAVEAGIELGSTPVAAAPP